MNKHFEAALPLGIPAEVDGFYNVLFVGPSSEAWTKAMEAQHGGRVFNTLQDAINAAPRGDGSSTYGFNRTKIFYYGQNSSATYPITVPKTRAGLEIIGVEGAYLSTTADLTADVPLLKIEADYVTIRNLRLFTTQASQVGDALHLGSASGAALYSRLENVIVHGPENGVYTDFTRGIVLKDAKYSVLKDCKVYGSTGTTEGIAIMTGIGDSTGVELDNCFVKIITGGASTKPLTVTASQNYGHIKGGVYMTDSGATAIEIAGNGWTLSGGGLACNTDTVGASAQIDITGTGVTVGPFYVKDSDANTAPTLFDQTNV